MQQNLDKRKRFLRSFDALRNDGSTLAIEVFEQTNNAAKPQNITIYECIDGLVVKESPRRFRIDRTNEIVTTSTDE